MDLGGAPARRQALLAGAFVIMLAGFALNCNAARFGVDFPSLYVIGRGVLTGTNVYDGTATAVFPERYGVAVPLGMFYPPATGFSMLPFALLPYSLAKLAWFLTIDVTLIFGLRSLVKLVAPRAGSHVWMLCVGIVLGSSALRWGMLLLQGAPLALGLLCWFVVTTHTGRARLAGALAVLAVAVKMTLSLPFLGLLLLQRRFVAAFTGVAVWAALNGLGFARMGATALKDYQRNIAVLESFGNINSPDPWNVASSPRLDWTSLFFGLSGSLAPSRIASLALSGLVSLWLLREGLRTPPPPTLRTTTLFLMPLVCLGSLCVYHHHYDASLLFAPALLIYFVIGPRQIPRWGLALMLPVLAMILVMPIGVVQSAVNSLFGTTGIGLMKLSFPVAVTAALAGGLVTLSSATRAPAGSESRAPQRTDPHAAPSVRS